MNFYTKKWHDYIYSYWIKETNYRINYTEENNDLDDKLAKKEEEKLINNDFENYYKKRKDYINNYEYLEKEFGKNNYERIKELSKEEVKEEYMTQIISFEKTYKNKYKLFLKKLKSCDIDISKYDIDINKINYRLLLFKIITKNTRNFFKNIEKALMEKNLFSGDLFIVKFTISFLTDYWEYLDSINDKFDYEYVNDILYSFHDSTITKYEYNNDSIIIEMQDDYGLNITNRIIFKNVKINYDKDLDLTNKIINSGDFGNYSDYKYYISIRIAGMKYDLEFIADKIIAEQFNTDELLESYLRTKDLYFKNLKTVKGIIDPKVYNIFCSVLTDTRILKYEKKDNLFIIEFQDSIFKRYHYNLLFEDSIVSYYINNKKVNQNDFEESYIKLLGQNNEKKGLTKIKHNGNNIEVSLLLLRSKEYTYEIIINCKNIKLENFGEEKPLAGEFPTNIDFL